MNERRKGYEKIMRDYISFGKKLIYIILFGLIFFLYLIFKKKLNINILIFSIILFFFIFINYENGHNIDSPVYHTQTIRWAYDKKIIFGLSNLDWLYSLNSGWHIFLSLLKFKIKSFDTIYVLNFLPLTVLIPHSLSL